MKTRLIKRKEINEQQKPGTAPAAPVGARNPAEVLHEWLNKREKSEKSARQAFAALFAEGRTNNAT